MVGHPNEQDGGPDNGSVPGQQQEPPEAPVRPAGQLVLLGPEDPLADGERAGRAEGAARATLQVRHPRHLARLGRKKFDVTLSVYRSNSGSVNFALDWHVIPTLQDNYRNAFLCSLIILFLMNTSL